MRDDHLRIVGRENMYSPGADCRHFTCKSLNLSFQSLSREIATRHSVKSWIKPLMSFPMAMALFAANLASVIPNAHGGFFDRDVESGIMCHGSRFSP